MGSGVRSFLLIAALLPAIQTITVSPDLGVRNTTTKSPTEKFIPLIYNKTTDDTINIPDRYRRLIPYMTFYIPNQFPISQHYNFLPNHQQHVQQQPLTPSRQKQIIAVYQPQSHQQPPSEPENQPHQQQQHQHQQQQVQNLRSPIYVPARYSNQRPHYQTIIYNTRHQTATNKPSHGNQHIYPLQPQTDRVQVPVPVPFKESHVIKVPVHAAAHQHHHHLHQPLQPQLTSKFNLTPFSPGNKIPGHFTPIVYPEDENGIPFSPKVSPEQESVNDDSREQYGEISLDIPSESGVHKYPPQPVNQQIQVLQLQPQPSPGNFRQPQRVSLLQPLQIHPSPSPTPRPVLTIVTEFPITHQQNNNHRHQLQDEPPRHQLQDETPRHQMTNEEKYVAYLQEKIKQRELQRNSQLQQQSQNQQQQHHQQQHQQLAPATNHEQHRLLQPVPQNYINIVKTTRIPDNHATYNEKEPQPHIVYPIKTDLPREYEHLSESEDAPPEQSLTSNTNESDGEYINYPHLDRLPNQSPSPRPKQYYKPKLVYFTTPPPIIITPSVPIYEESFPPQVTKTPMRNPTYQDSFYGERTAPKLVPSSPSTSRPQVQITSSRAPSIAASYRPQHALQKPQYYDNPESVRQNHSPIYDTTAIKLKNSYKPVIQTKPTPFAAPRRKLTKLPPPPPSPPTPPHERPFPDLATSSLAEILHKLQESNHLPKTLTPDNIDNSIKTLVKILNNLKESQTIVDNPPQHHEEDYDEYEDTPNSGENYDHNHKPGPNTGRPGIDYPALAEIPHTRFNCKEQRYKGFFGDPETNCQVWHYCDLNGGQASFLCPNGTIFSQVALTCDWWFNVKCSSTAQLYVLNERLYKYILPFTPKFPEDYSGPLVDKYLALKFQEMEEKMRKQKLKGKHTSEDGNAESEESNSGEINESADTEEDTSSEEDDEVKGTIDTGLPYPGSATNATSITSTTESSLSKQPVVVSTTVSPSSTTRSPGQPETKTVTSVESEKVEVIEIKSDGSSGHLIPNPDGGYNSRK